LTALKCVLDTYIDTQRCFVLFVDCSSVQNTFCGIPIIGDFQLSSLKNRGFLLATCRDVILPFQYVRLHLSVCLSVCLCLLMLLHTYTHAMQIHCQMCSEIRTFSLYSHSGFIYHV